MKLCLKCAKQIADDALLCDCGYEFGGPQTLQQPTRTARLFVFLLSLVPVIGLILGLLSSEWFYNRYGFSGAWILLPAILATTTLILSTLYYCTVFVSGSILDRIGASLALGIFAVILSFGLCFVLFGFMPHSRHPG